MLPSPPAAWPFLWRWGPSILWMVVISGFSTEAFSAEQTGRFLLSFLRWLFPGALPRTLDLLHFGFRKGMHVIEFGILALLWYRALGRDRNPGRMRPALAALALASGFAVADETHQAFVAARTASLADVGWDTLGAVLALASRWIFR